MLLPHQWHGAGTPLVLIAGLGARGTSWHPFLARAARRFRVLTFDTRGSGASAPLAGPVTLRQLAEDVLRLLDHLNVGRACVAGRSMGGMIAQELALLAPGRIERLALVSTTGRVDAHLAEVFGVWAQMAEQRVPAELRHQSSMLWCLGREALTSRASVRAYLRARAGTDRPADYALQARACAAHDALVRLAGLRVPTLVVHGTEDRLMPVPHAEALARVIPEARLAHIPGAGHLAYLESPDRFAAEVLEFFESRAEPRAAREEALRCPSSSTGW